MNPNNDAGSVQFQWFSLFKVSFFKWFKKPLTRLSIIDFLF